MDLYLLHAPQKLFPEGSPDQQGAWKQLEELVDEGLVKNIGISNHRVSDVKKILETAKITPAVNQVGSPESSYRLCCAYKLRLAVFLDRASSVYLQRSQGDRRFLPFQGNQDPGLLA